MVEPVLESDVAEDGRPDAYVQSLERGLAVIRSFSREHPRLSLTDVAKVTGMTRAAARRYLLTLQHLGYVGSDGREFFLRSPVLQLGYAYLASLSLAEVAQEHLVHLAESLHESCSASVLDGEDIVYVARASTTRVMSISLTVGARLPAHCTAMGRMLLSALPDDRLDDFLANADLSPRSSKTITDPEELRAEILKVRKQDWCIVDEELEPGVRSVAVLLRDGSGVVGAMNVSAHTTRVTLAKLQGEFLREAQMYAGRINAALGARLS